MPTTRLSFSYPEEMKAKLKGLAKKDCRSLSSYIQMILSEHIEKCPIVLHDKESSKKKVSNRKRA